MFFSWPGTLNNLNSELRTWRFSSGPSFFSVAVLSGLCLLVGNLSAMRFSYVCFHSILISAPHRLAEIWKLSQRRFTGGIGGWIQIPETWVLVLCPFLLCCQNAPQSLLAGYYHSYPLGWSNWNKTMAKSFQHIYLFSALVRYVLRTFNIESFEKFVIKNYSLLALRRSSNASFLLGTLLFTLLIKPHVCATRRMFYNTTIKIIQY